MSFNNKVMFYEVNWEAILSLSKWQSIFAGAKMVEPPMYLGSGGELGSLTMTTEGVLCGRFLNIWEHFSGCVFF